MHCSAFISCGSRIENVLFSVNAKNPDDEDRCIVKQLKHDIAGIFTSLDKTPISIINGIISATKISLYSYLCPMLWDGKTA